MTRKERKYKRLPGRPLSPFDVRSLWIGPDHLLWVESVFFKENYKRFFYNDIQSVILQRNDTHLLWSSIWGALALICGLIAFLVSGTPYVSVTLAAVFLLALGINLALGASCTVFLQTAAQVQKISTLKRMRTAQKAMDRIKALAEKMQGPWEKRTAVVAEVSASEVLTARSSSANVPASVLKQGVGSPPAGSFDPRLHQALFSLLLALGALGAIQLQLRNLLLGIGETLLHGGAQIMVIVALIRWHRHLKGTLTVKLNWLALVFIVVQTIIGYGLYFAVSFGNPQISYHHWAMFKKMFELQWIDHPLALAGNLLYAGGNLLLGIGGWFVLRRHHGP